MVDLVKYKIGYIIFGDSVFECTYYLFVIKQQNTFTGQYTYSA